MKTRIVLVLITLVCAATTSVQSARSTTITVTNTNDSGPGSLRDALAVANDGDTIDATGVSGTILLTSGQLEHDPRRHHQRPRGGPSGRGRQRAKSRVLRQSRQDRHRFRPDYYEMATSPTTSAAAFITMARTLTITNCTLDGNSADYGGGGISNYASNARRCDADDHLQHLEQQLGYYGGGISNGAFSGGALADGKQQHYQWQLSRVWRRHLQATGGGPMAASPM